MTICIEDLKSMNLVEFLTHHYGLNFHRSGEAYVCSSPFTEDRNPSFFVRLVRGHWLFKDFSSGHFGSIFDFVRIMENLPDFSAALKHVCRLVGSIFQRPHQELEQGSEIETKNKPESRGYDVNHLYDRFRREDVSVCMKYLLDRGIPGDMAADLVDGGIVVHNRYRMRSYCCFAVHDGNGDLMCLDNHEIDGSGKFILGQKSVFTLDWPILEHAEKVFVCEGVIDYLSVKVLEGDTLPGLALLGNQLVFDPGLLSDSGSILSALDDDKGGYSAILDLMDMYPEKEIHVYDLKGHKDPNELLRAGGKEKRGRLSAEDKLEIYRQFHGSQNKADLARKWGIDRSYMYEIVRASERILLSALKERRPGRKSTDMPGTVDEAHDRIKKLEKDYEDLATEKEKLHCRSEFLKLRLKWSEIEAAELRGDPVDEDAGVKKKSQIKKKRKKRRSR